MPLNEWQVHWIGRYTRLNQIDKLSVCVCVAKLKVCCKVCVFVQGLKRKLHEEVQKRNLFAWLWNSFESMRHALLVCQMLWKRYNSVFFFHYLSAVVFFPSHFVYSSIPLNSQSSKQSRSACNRFRKFTIGKSWINLQCVFNSSSKNRIKRYKQWIQTINIALK